MEPHVKMTFLGTEPLFHVSGELTGTLEMNISVFSLLCWLQVFRFFKDSLGTPRDSRPGPTFVLVCLGCAPRFLATASDRPGALLCS